MDSIYSLLDFKDEKSFLALQNRFLAFSISENRLEELDSIKKGDFVINWFDLTATINELSNITHQISFYNFLESGVELLAKNYESLLETDFEAKGIIFPEDKTKFIQVEINNFFKIQSQLKRFNFLPTKISNGLNKQIEIIIDFLSSLEFSRIDLERKIKCNLNRTSLLHLFYSLRKNNIIDSECSNPKLAYILNSYFLFKDDKSGEYMSVKYAGKVLSDTKTFNKTVKTSTQRLKRKFEVDSFFEIDIQ